MSVGAQQKTKTEIKKVSGRKWWWGELASSVSTGGLHSDEGCHSGESDQTPKSPSLCCPTVIMHRPTAASLVRDAAGTRRRWW